MAQLKARTSQALYERLARLARRNRRTMAEELRIAVERHLDASAPLSEAALEAAEERTAS